MTGNVSALSEPEKLGSIVSSDERLWMQICGHGSRWWSNTVTSCSFGGRKSLFRSWLRTSIKRCPKVRLHRGTFRVTSTSQLICRLVCWRNPKVAGEIPLPPKTGKGSPLGTLRHLCFARGWAFAYTAKVVRLRKSSPAKPASAWEDLPSTRVKAVHSMSLSFQPEWSPPALVPSGPTRCCLGPSTVNQSD